MSISFMGIRITDGGPLMLPNLVVLMLRGKPVWSGLLGGPWEDVLFDEMILHTSDISRLAEVAAKGSAE